MVGACIARTSESLFEDGLLGTIDIELADALFPLGVGFGGANALVRDGLGVALWNPPPDCLDHLPPLAFVMPESCQLGLYLDGLEEVVGVSASHSDLVHLFLVLLLDSGVRELAADELAVSIPAWISDSLGDGVVEVGPSVYPPVFSRSLEEGGHELDLDRGVGEVGFEGGEIGVAVS